MKYHQIDRDLFIKNRAKFTAQMKPKSVAVFNSNDIYPISADSTMPFEQHRDIFYLSGVDQEESILLLFPDAPYENQREILFLKETNDHIAVWEGEKLTKERGQNKLINFPTKNLGRTPLIILCNICVFFLCNICAKLL